MGNIDSYVPISTPRQGIIIGFDDGLSSVYSIAYPYMKSKGLYGNAYIITSKIGDSGYCTAEQLQEMGADGWCIGNHTHTHAYFDTDELTQEQVETELSTAKGILDGLGLTAASSHVAYPGGEVTTASDAAMTAQSMVTGRTVGQTLFYIPLLSDYYRVPGYSLNSTHTFEDVKTLIDGAVTNEQIRSLVFHGLVESGAGGSQITISLFYSIIDYIASLTLRKLTIVDLINKKNLGGW